MKSSEIREKFFEFFRTKQHTIVPSAPMVIKDDPTLMFTNAGMNQFKDIFLGHAPVSSPRIADSPKCLRVSGKHNDLEEVGHDTYHHTMFEMLGNWSFGDYFKKEAIDWAWELLTQVYGIPKDKLFVTVFGGDASDGLALDEEARGYWKAHLPEDRILLGSKKDNFWEMGESGPCGPCSEIHVDLRTESERRQVPGQSLVNHDHPQVVEVWNLVFIEFNRRADGSLEKLPASHVDTGMGFERLCMALQGKTSNYDTDVFQPLIQKISEIAGIPYGQDKLTDIAMRVVADHLRAVAFAIADGQLPSNVRAGYVIRRILRRAIRYAFTFLKLEEPFIYQVFPVLAGQMGDVFPELRAQRELVSRVIAEEEHSFLKTLSLGIQRFQHYLLQHPGDAPIDGAFAFELFDTYGFPEDLTRLLASEQGREVDMQGFEKGLSAQKERSRADAATELGDWTLLMPEAEETRFTGYDELSCEARIVKYRQVTARNKTLYQVVLDRTPFYAESGGQVGDRGWLEQDGKRVAVTDTRKENNLIVHLTDELPYYPEQPVLASVDGEARTRTECNHSATHLLHHALRAVLGSHVEQKGSLVEPDRLRFDFSHFARMEASEVVAVEQMVNRLVRSNAARDEHRAMPMAQAREMGAMALFGEKYGDEVRVIRFGDSVELCGGTHVESTGRIGLFKITSESGIAAGVRRIEAVTGEAAQAFLEDKVNQLEEIHALFKNSKDPVRSVKELIETQKETERRLRELESGQVQGLRNELLARVKEVDGVQFLAARLDLNPKQVKDLAFELSRSLPAMFLVIGSVNDNKPMLTVMVSESLTASRGLHAGNIVRELARHIQGGGGGQPHFATAGGKDPSGIEKALEAAESFLP